MRNWIVLCLYLAFLIACCFPAFRAVVGRFGHDTGETCIVICILFGLLWIFTLIEGDVITISVSDKKCWKYVLYRTDSRYALDKTEGILLVIDPDGKIVKKMVCTEFNRIRPERILAQNIHGEFVFFSSSYTFGYTLGKSLDESNMVFKWKETIYVIINGEEFHPIYVPHGAVKVFEDCRPANHDNVLYFDCFTNEQVSRTDHDKMLLQADRVCYFLKEAYEVDYWYLIEVYYEGDYAIGAYELRGVEDFCGTDAETHNLIKLQKHSLCYTIA